MFSPVSAGVSLIELLVVIAIIGILAAVGIFGYQGFIIPQKKRNSTGKRQSGRPRH
ncbi:MAG: prepilin-type N-terminal cleavage/methylation domain-containing protein [Alphaproteobacteria bacterium]|nr:prepilin-type N-terminal cleavage/methylation domain-containing protein [Alphaproteobacteria bacterium]